MNFHRYLVNGGESKTVRMPGKNGLFAGKGFRYYFPYVWQAFLLSDPKQQDEVFQQYMESQEDYDKAVSQLQNLEETYDELLENKVISSKEDLKRYGVVGWDAGRVCFLARAVARCVISQKKRLGSILTERTTWHIGSSLHGMTWQ